MRELVKGLDLFIRGEHAAAAPILKRVVERDPDNVEARAALGDCLREVGEPAEAHRHHFQVARLLGRDTLGVRLSHARDLLALGRADEARAATLAALERASESAEGLRLLRECARAAGDLEGELDAVRRLLAIDLGSDERRRLETNLPEIEARLGRRLLAAGDAESAKRARRLLESAVGKRPTLAGARADLLAIETGARGAALLEALAPPRGGTGAATRAIAAPAPGTTAIAAAEPSGAPGSEALRAFLASLARFRCRECSAPARDFRVLCAACGALGTIGEVDGALLRPLKDARAVADEIERSPEYLRAVALRAAEGDAAATNLLRRTLPDSIEAVLLAATEAREPGRLVAALSEFAAESLDGVIEAFVRVRVSLAGRGALRRAVAPRRAVEPLVAEVVAVRAGADAAVYAALFSHADAAVRAVALEAAIRGGHAEAIDRHGDRAGAAAIRERVRALPAPLLGSLLAGIRPGGVLAREVLVDPSLSHDRAIFDAAFAAPAGSGARAALLDVLRSRGAAPGFLRALLESPDDALAPAEWERVVGALSMEGLAAVVFDAAAGRALRLACARSLAARGAPALDAVLDALDRSGDKGLATAIAVLAGLGSAGGPALAARPEINEKAGLFGARRAAVDKRRLRRTALAEALARIGGAEAARAIRGAAEAAKDDSEKRHLEDLARRAADAAAGGEQGGRS